MTARVPPLRSHAELADWIAGLDPGPDDALPPQIADLWHLYATARLSGAVSVLEIGAGWSTAVWALAVAETEEAIGPLYRARHPSPFTVTTIDASAAWLDAAVARIPADLRPRVRGVASTAIGDMVDARACHTFGRWPIGVLPDIVYLDGPDPDQVGQVRGLSPDSHGLPMSADLVAVEPYLLPETLIIVDGRTANARFLASQFRRRWEVLEDPWGDRTTMRLAEPPLGRHHRQHLHTRHLAAEATASGPDDAWGVPR